MTPTARRDRRIAKSLLSLERELDGAEDAIRTARAECLDRPGYSDARARAVRRLGRAEDHCRELRRLVKVCRRLDRDGIAWCLDGWGRLVARHPRTQRDIPIDTSGEPWEDDVGSLLDGLP